MISTLIIFIIILAVLIFVHEFGHFVVAKRSGVRVDEFGFGFPPRIFSWKKGETRYSINLIPLGGFVKIFGEQGEGKGEKNSFMSKSISRRSLIIVAGVLMNFILAAFLFWIGHTIGLPTSIEGGNFSGATVRDFRTQISDIAPGSPAEQTGIKIGDTIEKLKIDVVETKEINAGVVQDFISAHKGEEIIIMVKSGGVEKEISITPRLNPPENEGPLGIALADTAIVSYPWWKALYKGVADTISITILIITILGAIIHKAFLGAPVGEVLTGPVGIYNITSQAAGMGLIYLLQLTALLSINLGLINILPFPALDGGRLLFLAIEKVKGSPVSQRVEGAIHTIGFALLILLMIFVTWRDIVRFF